jgi:peptidoglycan hydrolase-like protein with peptidoglycan-binding domain
MNPFGSGAITMSVYNEFFQRATPNTPNALQLKRAWDLWYNNLTWYERSVGSPHTLRDANSRVVAFRVMNGESKFGAEPMRQTIRLGDTGPSVSEWQGVLGIAKTGVFDAATKEATKNYQTGKGLTADGIVGPATWGTVPVQGPSVGSALKSRMLQSGPLIAVGSALVAGGILAATLSPLPSRRVA